MKSLVVAFGGLAMVAAPILAAAPKPPLVLSPSSKWNLN